MRRYAAIPFIVGLSPGHSDIIMFRPWSTNTTGNYLDRVQKIPNFSQTTGTVEVFDPCYGIWDPLHGEFPHVKISMNVVPNPLTCDA